VETAAQAAEVPLFWSGQSGRVLPLFLRFLERRKSRSCEGRTGFVSLFINARVRARATRRDLPLFSKKVTRTHGTGAPTWPSLDSTAEPGKASASSFPSDYTISCDSLSACSN
jgi:hypothetical protein